jgi:hypothetical protein
VDNLQNALNVGMLIILPLVQSCVPSPAKSLTADPVPSTIFAFYRRKDPEPTGTSPPPSLRCSSNGQER